MTESATSPQVAIEPTVTRFQRESWPKTRAGQLHVAARVSCLTLGGAYIVWGVAPILISRMATGDVDMDRVLVLGSLSAALGVLFLVLYQLISRRVGWAKSAVFGLSLALTTSMIGAWIMTGWKPVSIFLLFMSTVTMVFSWLSLNTKEALTPTNAST